MQRKPQRRSGSFRRRMKTCQTQMCRRGHMSQTLQNKRLCRMEVSAQNQTAIWNRLLMLRSLMWMMRLLNLFERFFSHNLKPCHKVFTVLANIILPNIYRDASSFSHPCVVANLPGFYFLLWSTKGDVLKNVLAALFHAVTVNARGPQLSTFKNDQRSGLMSQPLLRFIFLLFEAWQLHNDLGTIIVWKTILFKMSLLCSLEQSNLGLGQHFVFCPLYHKHCFSSGNESLVVICMVFFDQVDAWTKMISDLFLNSNFHLRTFLIWFLWIRHRQRANENVQWHKRLYIYSF